MGDRLVGARYAGIIEQAVEAPEMPDRARHQGLDIHFFGDIGFDEYVDGDGVCLIEWADKFPEILPEDRTEIRLDVLDAARRELKIN